MDVFEQMRFILTYSHSLSTDYRYSLLGAGAVYFPGNCRLVFVYFNCWLVWYWPWWVGGSGGCGGESSVCAGGGWMSIVRGLFSFSILRCRRERRQRDFLFFSFELRYSFHSSYDNAGRSYGASVEIDGMHKHHRLNCFLFLKGGSVWYKRDRKRGDAGCKSTQLIACGISS